MDCLDRRSAKLQTLKAKGMLQRGDPKPEVSLGFGLPCAEHLHGEFAELPYELGPVEENQRCKSHPPVQLALQR